MIKTRIAPAPTGKLHIGTARAALFNYLFTKQKRGVFVVRIEDTDEARSKKEFEDDVRENLRWLGLGWDEWYRQSERMKLYKKYIGKLLEQGRAFYCSHSKEETQGGVHFCKNRESKKIQDTRYKIQDTVIRFKTPQNREIEFQDIVRGSVRFNTNELGDFSIAKSREEPLWILAVTADDHEMGITHIIRGEDHISNTPKQILLVQALAFSTPVFAHLPLILGSDRTKLSKRHGALSIGELREEGYLPEAIVNMMAFMGWNPGDEREFFTLEELVKEFSLERVKKGSAVFNMSRLEFMNQHYLRTLPASLVAKQAKKYIEESYGRKTVKNFNKLKDIISLERQRVKTLKELAESVKFIFNLDSYNPGLLEWKDQTGLDAKQSLEEVFHIIEKIPSNKYNKDTLGHILLREAERRGGDRGALLWPLRVALSGKAASPGPFEIGGVLGKKETLRRIQYAIKSIS